MVVHGLDQALAALGHAGPRGVLLLSAPDAAARAGAGWFMALLAEARAAHPAIPVDAALDCGPWAGLALGAIRAGVGIVILSEGCPAFAAVAGAAAEANIMLWNRRPQALDLGELDLRRRDAHKKIADWLSAIGSPREQGMPPAR